MRQPITTPSHLKPCNLPTWLFGRIQARCGLTDGVYDECCYVFEREQLRPSLPSTPGGGA